MLFRIDKERYLAHAIDHFTRDELVHFEYLIISAGVNNGGREKNVSKSSTIYPDLELIESFALSSDLSTFRKEYFKQLDELSDALYNGIINNVINHKDIVIVCIEKENFIIDVLMEYLKDKYKIDCIDLNQLFINGRVGAIYIDRDEIRNKAVDIRRKAIKNLYNSYESTSGGRLELLKKMNLKNKIKKLKSLGVKVGKEDLKELDKLLIELWVEDD